MTVEEQIKVLETARKVYGNKNQILVCIEELNELACVLAKFPRYEDEDEAREKLTEKVIDEVADVMIILDHVQKIFDIPDGAIADRIMKKIERLERWLKNSTSMQRTLEDRVVGVVDCKTCQNRENPEYSMCKTCMSTEGTEGVRPFYKPRKE